MLSAVIDSTVLVSAFLGPRGVSDAVLGQADAGRFILYLAEESLTNLLSLRTYDSITIVTPEVFMATLRDQ